MPLNREPCWRRAVHADSNDAPYGLDGSRRSDNALWCLTTMSEELKQKLNRSQKDECERDALSELEYQAVMRMLRADVR